MPALTMRGRYLMREYWADSGLFMKLTAEVREFYQGLWMLCDDDGWMPRDIAEIGAALYRYEDRAPREAKVRSGLSRLADMGKVKSHRCGCLFVPAVANYPRPGQKSHEHFEKHKEHQKGSKPLRQTSSTDNDDVQTGSNPIPDPTRPLSDPTVARAQARGGEPTRVSEFQQRLPRPA